MGSNGLRNALERSGCLDYVFDQLNDKFCNYDRLRSNPIFYVRGFLDGRMPFVARAGNQFKATWNSESWFTKEGVLDTSTPFVEKNQEHFNMMFTSAETDLNKYKVPTYFLPSWVDTTIFDDVCEPEYDGLGFIGERDYRADFFAQDKNGIINQMQTSEAKGDPVRQTREYVDLICKHKMLVSPPGKCFNGMTGRGFEIMGCKRLAFIYLNEETMFKHKEFFKDGIDCVYWKTFEELEDKYNFYKKRPDLVYEISKHGYENVRANHNQDVRAKYIIDCMEKEYCHWQEDQSKISKEISSVHSMLC